MKLQVLVIAVSIGCAARQDTSVLGERVGRLEAEVASLRTAAEAASRAPAPAPEPKPRPRPRRKDDLADRAPEPSANDRIAALEEQVRKLERSTDEAWNELERVMFGDARALDGRPANAPRPVLKPDVSYSVPVSPDHPREGDDAAKVTWVMGIELTEPYSRRLLDVAKAIRPSYGADLRIVYKHFVVHDFGVAAAMVLCAAHRQGKFAEALEELGKRELRDRAAMRIGVLRDALRSLDRAALDIDLTGAACRKRVRDDHLFAQQYGMTGTPYSFINGRPVNGAQPEEAFRKVIDEELAKANAELGARSSKGYYDKLVKRGAKP